MPKSTTIAHATDLLPDGGIAFEHAVALASEWDARLVTLYAKSKTKESRRPLPDAQALLDKWQLSAIEHESRSHQCCEDPVDTLLDALGQVNPELLIVGRRPKTPLERLFKGSTSISVALNANIPTLFLSIGERGFVTPQDGKVHLEKIVVPVSNAEDWAATEMVLLPFLERFSHKSPVEVTLLCVGDGCVLESLSLPEREGVTFNRMLRQGKLSQAICAVADELGANLIAMASRGQDSLKDAVFGSHTEQVIRESHCPLLYIPMSR